MVESSPFALVRYAAAMLVVAAGVVHLAQIGPHSDEDPLFGLFFLVVGLIQVAGGLYLVYPLGPDRLRVAFVRFGVVGSVATVCVWAVSRTAGLPFGAEPGVPETIGLADAAADLFELITALLLAMWIYRPHLGVRSLTRVGIAGASAALALAGLWLLTRQLHLFDPDPRLVAYGDLADLAAVGFLALVAILFARVLFVARTRAPASKMASLAVLAPLGLAALLLVAFTLPARGGQNPDCAYGPIREDSGLSHTTLPAPIHLAAGEVKSVVVLLLAACGPDRVAITSFDLIQPLGNAIVLERITVDRSRVSRADRVRPGPGSGPPAVGTLLDASQGRYPVVVQVRGLKSGVQALSAFKIGWAARAAAGSIGLASFTTFCVADALCPTPPSR